MNPTQETFRHRLALLTGIFTLVLLIGLSLTTPSGQADLLPGLFFCVLIVFTMTFGVRLGGGLVSLMPMTVAAAYLVLGLVLAGWVTFASSAVHGLLRYHGVGRSTEPGESSGFEHIARTAMNAAMHTVSILAGGAVFQFVGGTTPLAQLDVATSLRLVLLGLTQLSANFIIAGAYIVTLGRAPLRSYLDSLPKLVVFEGGPLIFAALVALTYTQLGLFFFILLCLNFVAGSLISYNLDAVNRRLGRRVKELDSLQAVGQALSASLDTETVVSAIYDQVARLMPAHEFYVALYDSQSDDVSFPFVVEGGARIEWQSRRAGNDLTEYVLKTQTPLLIRNNVKQRATALGLNQMGREAKCWLGVPIVVGAEPLGIIAVQSFDTPGAYTSSHQRVLVTIAAQASTAIQNASRYVRTDEALTRRVQELDSILRSTRDGFLLLGLDWRVLTINRTLTGWVNVDHSEEVGQLSDESLPNGESLMRLIGYTPRALERECEALTAGESAQRQAIVLLGPSMRHVERTLMPVRDQDEKITGWLLAFRDMTEEIELARLKDDMTEMLVHDLRSPLTAVIGSVALLKRTFEAQDEAGFEKLRNMAENNADRIMHMVNQLLDISRLESGQLLLQREPISVEALFKDAQTRFAPLATEARIELTAQVKPGLPPVCADPSLISRTLDNLLDNAIKFTPDGGQVRLRAGRNDEADSEMVRIAVSDTGPGIPEKAQARLFEKFQQVGSIEGRRSGTGLGLAFCKLVVEAHGGQIWVDSEVGKGSTFVFVLPGAQL